jgi:hypothetical protein
VGEKQVVGLADQILYLSYAILAINMATFGGNRFLWHVCTANYTIQCCHREKKMERKSKGKGNVFTVLVEVDNFLNFFFAFECVCSKNKVVLLLFIRNELFFYSFFELSG